MYVCMDILTYNQKKVYLKEDDEEYRRFTCYFSEIKSNISLVLLSSEMVFFSFLIKKKKKNSFSFIHLPQESKPNRKKNL